MKYQYKDFEDYLEWQFARNSMALDDDLPDATNAWIGNLDPQELIDFANEWAKTIKEDVVNFAQKAADDLLNSY